jgi:hypothetical protein
MIQNFASSKMAKMLHVETREPLRKGIILPDAVIRQVWDFVIFLGINYLAVMIPVEVAFELHTSIPFLVYLNLAIDVFFAGDIAAKIHFFAVMKDGFLITDRDAFRQIYFSHAFVEDLIYVFPVPLILYLCGIRGRAYALLRVFQGLRVKRFGAYFERMMESIAARRNWQLSTSLMRIIQMTIFVIAMCHWFGCCFYALGNSSEGYSWILADEMDSAPNYNRYTRALYWAFYTRK